VQIALLEAQPGVAPLKIAGAVVRHAVPQDQVLRARRCADRVGLDKAEAREDPAKR